MKKYTLEMAKERAKERAKNDRDNYTVYQQENDFIVQNSAAKKPKDSMPIFRACGDPIYAGDPDYIFSMGEEQ